MPQTPGQLYQLYMSAVRSHGYDSQEAATAYEVWVAECASFGRQVSSDRRLNTARPFNDKRPLNEIYPAP